MLKSSSACVLLNLKLLSFTYNSLILNLWLCIGIFPVYFLIAVVLLPFFSSTIFIERVKDTLNLLNDVVNVFIMLNRQLEKGDSVDMLTTLKTLSNYINNNAVYFNFYKLDYKVALIENFGNNTTDVNLLGSPASRMALFYFLLVFAARLAYTYKPFPKLNFQQHFFGILVYYLLYILF
jgi:hypothetical protein